MKLFVVAPVIKNDRATETITSVWAEEIIALARSMHLDVIPKVGYAVTREQVNLVLSTYPQETGIFCFIDHGLKDSLTGSDGHPLIDETNASLLKNKLIYAVCCSAGAQFGPMVVEHGAIGFIGYQAVLNICLIGDAPKLTGTCFFKGLVAMLKQKSSLENAYHQIQSRFEEAIQTLHKNKNIPEKLLTLATLYHNRKALVVYGNRNWIWHP